MCEHAVWGSKPQYNMSDTAYFLGTSPLSVTKLIKAGYIRALKYPSIHVPQSEIERFLNENVGQDLTEIVSVIELNEVAEKESKILNI